MKETNKYNVNDLVTCNIKPYSTWGDLVVMSHCETLSGWQYVVTFPKKDGTPHKRRERLQFHENQLSPSLLTTKEKKE
jgi:hypothetical protein